MGARKRPALRYNSKVSLVAVMTALLLLVVPARCDSSVDSMSSSPPVRAVRDTYARTRTPFEQALIPAWRATFGVIRKLAGTGAHPRNIKALRAKNYLQAERADPLFPCNVSASRSSEPPRSVHRLRPGDVDVVAAMGDSLTAANGALAVNVVQVFNENRGASWSGGGQGSWREFVTLPNILKEFNPALIGYSLRDAHAFERESVFNVAEINAMSQDLPWQAANLVKRIRADPRVDLERHWKLVTILVGSNDFCSDMCYRRNPESLPEQHRDDLREALRILKSNLPRTFVNLALQPNIADLLPDMRNPPLSCVLIRTYACPCLYGGVSWKSRQRMREIILRYQQVEMEVVEDPEFQTDDFTVVLQPFTLKLSIPLKHATQTDFSYFSPDCFHFSQKGYARAATAIWNNLIEPVGTKTQDWMDHLLCPTEQQPFLATRVNSRSYITF